MKNIKTLKKKINKTLEKKRMRMVEKSRENEKREKKRKGRGYILIEEMAMNGPIESVLEGTTVEDPNPLLLRCSSR